MNATFTNTTSDPKFLNASTSASWTSLYIVPNVVIPNTTADLVFFQVKLLAPHVLTRAYSVMQAWQLPITVQHAPTSMISELHIGSDLTSSMQTPATFTNQPGSKNCCSACVQAQIVFSHPVQYINSAQIRLYTNALNNVLQSVAPQLSEIQVETSFPHHVSPQRTLFVPQNISTCLLHVCFSWPTSDRMSHISCLT